MERNHFTRPSCFVAALGVVLQQFVHAPIEAAEEVGLATKKQRGGTWIEVLNHWGFRYSN